MEEYLSLLNWIDTQKQDMQELVIQWASINTHTFNLNGLKSLSQEMKRAFSVFGEDIEEVSLPPFESINIHGGLEEKSLAPALFIRKRPKAKKQGLFVVHMDTIYTPEDTFQEVVCVDDQILKGPGVTDAKGGIAVLLKALEAFEQSSLRDKIGWQVIINTDEEIGSPGSLDFLKKQARKCHIGLVFEPCFEDGSFVGSRKGSGSYTIVARGRSAHAGRDFYQGRNVINTLSRCIVSINRFNESREGLTVNFGVISGGTAPNVVPDRGITRFNVRVRKREDQDYFQENLHRIVDEIAREDEVALSLHGGFTAPPKPMEGKTLDLYKQIQLCASDLELNLNFRESGGVCDGNRLNAFGLPTFDSLGVQGGHIHSHEEYLFTKSLRERAKLTTLFLLKWAKGEWEV